jgi:hypothetical protein
VPKAGGETGGCMNQDQRSGMRNTRIPTEYRATYTLGNITGEGYITDISENGVAIRSNQVLVPGDKIQVSSTISNNLTLEFEGEVRNIQGNNIGIMITDIDPDLHERFMSHIDSMLRMMNKKRNEPY